MEVGVIAARVSQKNPSRQPQNRVKLQRQQKDQLGVPGRVEIANLSA